MPKANQRLSVQWTKNLRDSEKEEFQSTVRGSITALRRLKELLTEYEGAILANEFNEQDFTGDWPYKAAFRNGQRSAYKKIKELLDWIDT